MEQQFNFETWNFEISIFESLIFKISIFESSIFEISIFKCFKKSRELSEHEKCTKKMTFSETLFVC